MSTPSSNLAIALLRPSHNPGIITYPMKTSNLLLLALLILSAFFAPTAMSQDYRVHEVCRSLMFRQEIYVINYDGTVPCKEGYSWDPNPRVTFDNPYYRPMSLSIPTVPLERGPIASINGVSRGSIVVGNYLPYHSEGVRHRGKAFVAADGRIWPISNPFLAGEDWEATGINDQGWIILNNIQSRTFYGLIPVGPAYVRIPSEMNFASGTNYEITCDMGMPFTTAINRNGLIGGLCGDSGNNRAVVWGWWDLRNPLDLTPYLPTMVDFDTGEGLLPRTDETFRNCHVEDMADTADIFLIECVNPVRARSRSNYIYFVNSPGGAFRQLPARMEGSLRGEFVWRAVNKDGCAVGGDFLPDRWQAIVDCGGLARYLSDTNDEMISIYDAYDINDQGHILTNSARGPAVLAR